MPPRLSAAAAAAALALAPWTALSAAHASAPGDPADSAAVVVAPGPADGAPDGGPVDGAPDGGPVDGAPAADVPAKDEPDDGDALDPASSCPAVVPAVPERPGVAEAVPGVPLVLEVPRVEQVLLAGEPGYVLPESGALSWAVNGRPVEDLAAEGRVTRRAADPAAPCGTAAYEVTASALGVTGLSGVVVAAVATQGHVFADVFGAPVTVVAVVDRRTGVEVIVPASADGDGPDDTYTVPQVPGLTYTADGTELAPGPHAPAAYGADGTATLTIGVRALDGHRLEQGGAPVETFPGEGGTAVVELVFDNLAPAAPAPEFADADGTAEDAVVVPHADGVEYVVDDHVLPPGRHPATGDVVVTARAAAGWTLAGAHVWSHTFTGGSGESGEPSEPAAQPAPGDGAFGGRHGDEPAGDERSGDEGAGDGGSGRPDVLTLAEAGASRTGAASEAVAGAGAEAVPQPGVEDSADVVTPAAVVATAADVAVSEVAGTQAVPRAGSAAAADPAGLGLSSLSGVALIAVAWIVVRARRDEIV